MSFRGPAKMVVGFLVSLPNHSKKGTLKKDMLNRSKPNKARLQSKSRLTMRKSHESKANKSMGDANTPSQRGKVRGLQKHRSETSLHPKELPRMGPGDVSGDRLLGPLKWLIPKEGETKKQKTFTCHFRLIHERGN